MKVRKAVIPAAGLGTRMLPAAKSVPKELLPLVDRPVLEYIVREAAAAGIEDILIITNRGKEAIEDYFDYAPALEASLADAGKTHYLDEVRAPAELANITFLRQKETKGLGHAVWCARSFVGDEPFAVLLGDDVMRAQTPVIGQLIEASERYGASAVGVQKVAPEAIAKYSSVQIAPLGNKVFEMTDVVEKPRPEQVYSLYAILGRYVLTSTIFDILRDQKPGFGGEIQLTDGLKTLCHKERMVAVDFEGKRFDTGNLCGFLEATLTFALDHPETGPWLQEYLKAL